jgi:hypothetical protein
LARELAGTLLPGERVERLPDGTITRIVVSNRNEAAQKANGVDFGIHVMERPSALHADAGDLSQPFEVQRVEGGRPNNLPA